jgi:hypothetical protein
VPDAYRQAALYAALGEKDKAFQWLEVAYRSRESFTPWLKLPLFAPLRSDPRLQDLLRRMNLPTFP